MNTSRCFPIEISNICIEHVVDELASHKFCGYLVTPNVDHMCRIYKNTEFKELYQSATLVVCDSKILQYLSMLSKTPIREIVRGSDLVVKLLESIEKTEEILVVGSDYEFPGKINRKFGLENVSVICPPMGFIKDQEKVAALVDEVVSSSARIVLLAVGSPQQEIVAKIITERSNSKAIICCGNAVNFAVDNVKRSPRWMSEVGLEWLHRCMVEPRRMIPRYIRNIEILWLYFTR